MDWRGPEPEDIANGYKEEDSDAEDELTRMDEYEWPGRVYSSTPMEPPTKVRTGMFLRISTNFFYQDANLHHHSPFVKE